MTAVVPYLAYARKDRQTKARDPVTTRYVAEKQQFAKLVVDRLPSTSMQLLQDVDILATHADKRSGLVLTVLEIAFLVFVDRHTESESKLSAKIP
ncbi:hypothetical protein ILFOPFJJ_05762 [Ensifer psoraleae]|nr:hypothetical protein [Sinorhizobium psoraleae]